MTNQEFKNEVLSYKGKYSEKELYRFIKYFTERKHFSKFKTFVISRRLQTWFDPNRKKKFNEKNKISEDDIRLKILKNSLGRVNPLR